jgi:hypothetical protein
MSRLLKSVRRPVPDVTPKIEQTWARVAEALATAAARTSLDVARAAPTPADRTCGRGRADEAMADTERNPDALADPAIERVTFGQERQKAASPTAHRPGRVIASWGQSSAASEESRCIDARFAGRGDVSIER